MIGPLGTREGAAWERIGLDRDGGVGVADAARGARAIGWDGRCA